MDVGTQFTHYGRTLEVMTVTKYSYFCYDALRGPSDPGESINFIRVSKKDVDVEASIPSVRVGTRIRGPNGGDYVITALDLVNHLIQIGHPSGSYEPKWKPLNCLVNGYTINRPVVHQPGVSYDI